MAVSKRMRYEILRRDGHRCRYCGAGPDERPLTVDHVLPVALGGGDEASNLVAACRDCNAGKAASSPDAPIVEAVSDDALRWAKAIQLAAAALEDERKARGRYLVSFYTHWCSWTWDGEIAKLPQDWDDSVGRFHSLGVSIETIRDAIDTMARKPGVWPDKRFNYFAGYCWRHVKDMQQIAADLIEGGEV